MMVPLSVLIPIRNERANIVRCLASVAWADDVWVVDSESSDGSKELMVAEAECRKRAGLGSAQIVQFRFNGTWPKKKNWALENLPFKHEWVFILDADEELPPEAEGEIRAIVESRADDRGLKTECGQRTTDDGGPREDNRCLPSDLGHPSSGAHGEAVAGYWINRRFMFMGQWLKHAYYPNWNLRLFKHRFGRYEKLTDAATASGDNEVHEHVIVKGATGRLRCEMNHYAFPSVEVFVEKHNRYSNWEARVAMDRFLRRSSSGLQAADVGWRRRLKAASHRLPFRPFLRFCYVFFWQRGFLDGWAGYYFARLHGMYELLCVAKEFELKRKADSRSGGSLSAVDGTEGSPPIAAPAAGETDAR